ncbi:hypothetical protein BV898_12447 [Hypsibius exemplaris]|uniref:peptidylprolyl isomerase n=1 Tax=Hypsibius exemplaris TaxID=2072580 RepID=A0A1W0WDP6_HYPEX|nr:hypothetical protein BV898_12447 [Hypsibius exemplaris]
MDLSDLTASLGQLLFLAFILGILALYLLRNEIPIAAAAENGNTGTGKVARVEDVIQLDKKNPADGIRPPGEDHSAPQLPRAGKQSGVRVSHVPTVVRGEGSELHRYFSPPQNGPAYQRVPAQADACFLAGSSNGNQSNLRDEEDRSSWASASTAELLRLSSSESDVNSLTPAVINFQTPNSGFAGKTDRQGRSRGATRSTPSVPGAKTNLWKVDGSNPQVVPNDVLGQSAAGRFVAGRNRDQHIPSATYSDNDDSRSSVDRFPRDGWVVNDGGVRKIVDTQGTGNKCPEPGAVVSILFKVARNIQFKLPNLYRMDTVTKFKLMGGDTASCDATNLTGLELGVLSMQVGEKSIFRIEPKYGYGMLKSDLVGVSSKDVIYIYIHLVEIQEEGLADAFLVTEIEQRLKKFSGNQLIVARDQLQRKGKNTFAQGDFQQASHYYKEAINAEETQKYIENALEIPTQGQSTKAQLLNNIALCDLKSGEWQDVVENCKKTLALKADRTSMVKACFLMAKATYELSGASAALLVVRRGLNLSSTNPDLLALQSLYEGKDIPPKPADILIVQKQCEALSVNLKADASTTFSGAFTASTPKAVPGPVTPAVPGPIMPVVPGPVMPAVPGPVTPAVPGPVTPVVPGLVTLVVPLPITPAVPGPITLAVPGPITPAVPGPVTPAVPGPITPAVPGPVTPAVPGPIMPAVPKSYAAGSSPQSGTNNTVSYKSRGSRAGQ